MTRTVLLALALLLVAASGASAAKSVPSNDLWTPVVQCGASASDLSCGPVARPTSNAAATNCSVVNGHVTCSSADGRVN